MYTSILIGTKEINSGVFSAAKALGAFERQSLAIKVLARTQPVSELARQEGVSRKFLYRQAEKACEALEDAFFTETDDHKVLLTCQSQRVAAAIRHGDGPGLPWFMSWHQAGI